MRAAPVVAQIHDAKGLENRQAVWQAANKALIAQDEGRDKATRGIAGEAGPGPEVV
jgi:hypothetical protein